MTWQVRTTRLLLKDLARLSKAERASVMEALKKLAEDPGSVDLRKLSGRHDEWRVRVGQLRVLVVMNKEQGIMFAERVMSRGDAYKE